MQIFILHVKIFIFINPRSVPRKCAAASSSSFSSSSSSSRRLCPSSPAQGTARRLLLSTPEHHPKTNAWVSAQPRRLFDSVIESAGLIQWRYYISRCGVYSINLPGLHMSAQTLLRASAISLCRHQGDVPHLQRVTCAFGARNAKTARELNPR